jgi:biotin synthase
LQENYVILKRKNNQEYTCFHRKRILNNGAERDKVMNLQQLNELERKVIEGENITKAEALTLMDVNLDSLAASANRIRRYFCGNVCDICSVVGVKTGQCTEDCRYCAQSTRAKIPVEEECVLGEDIVTDIARRDVSRGSYRYGLVSVGRRLNKKEVQLAAQNIADIHKNVDVHICASLGLLDKEDFTLLKEAGLDMIHNNLEASDDFFKTLCTSHTMEDKRNTIREAKACGLKVCSGGLIGLGETMEDRIDLAFSLKELGVDSVPVNMLNPIQGTDFENQKPMENNEFIRTVAIFRFILPQALIRLAAGRAFLSDNGKAALLAGANAVISGYFLTTTGITFESDIQMIKEQGYEINQTF